MQAVTNKGIKPGDVVVIRYEGPKGGPGMREMLGVTAAIVGEGMGESVALMTDGRFSGATRVSWWDTSLLRPLLADLSRQSKMEISLLLISRIAVLMLR
jgi:hypothetical protein